MTREEVIYKLEQMKRYSKYLSDDEIASIVLAIKALKSNADMTDAVYIDGFKAGYSQARFDLEQRRGGDK